MRKERKLRASAALQEYGVEDENYFEGKTNHYELDDSAAHMIRDNNKCILCRRCVAVYEKTQGIGVIGPNNRGFDTFIGSAFDMGLGRPVVYPADSVLQSVLQGHCMKKIIQIRS